MRKINKSVGIPHTLCNAPVPANADEVRRSIYGADDVRRQLMADQFDKCAYCECRVTKQYCDVEHYRPKRTYYWLGHSWDNLLYTCNLCNRTYKKDHFPLADETRRASSQDDISGEMPLIINPTKEEPLEHIRFNRHEMVGLTEKGRKTIELFHLNDRNERPSLVDDREQLYEKYMLNLKLKQMAEQLLQRQDIPEDADCIREILHLAEESIVNQKLPSNPYSGMLL